MAKTYLSQAQRLIRNARECQVLGDACDCICLEPKCPPAPHPDVKSLLHSAAPHVSLDAPDCVDRVAALLRRKANGES